ncbi:4-hydroxy-tetrahydrodipicolinate synthase [Alphaproteobacteria bacterium]|jgi:4-hydroxy-tetrahydrodipicolinate synthase|uniref:4-hydroxy-tetrahydrodipicolinate synthase n=1 Tax=Candidatus Levibacter sp. Uisw_134_01 TaxID=3230999 RepID=UPI0023385B0C|nr:4-hydroxy-tetrahydrodipicolinate synthase [Alphaproteobacteria bacterium]
MLFHSSYTALLTPFKDNKVDYSSYKELIDFQINNGTHGLVPVGTTGESPTLSHDEHKKLIEVCIEQSNGRVPVIAGAGSNSTSEAVDFVKHACSAGADGLLVVTPYYNKPTQSGLLAHYNELIKHASKPIIIYDIPGRSVIQMTDETMAKLAQDQFIVGVKDATADLTRPTRLQNIIGDNFIQLSGEDGTALAYLAAGGHGCISVTANIAPNLLSRMHNAWKQGDINTAQEINKKLMPLHDALFCETSPGPLKYAASLLGICSSDARLPIVEIEEDSKLKVKDALKKTGLI